MCMGAQTIPLRLVGKVCHDAPHEALHPLTSFTPIRLVPPPHYERQSVSSHAAPVMPASLVQHQTLTESQIGRLSVC